MSKLGEGRATRRGFFHVFHFTQPFSDKELELVAHTMRQIVKEARPITVKEMMRSNAVEFFTHHGQHELAKVVAGHGLATICHIGNFFDLCEEVAADTSHIGALHLTDFERAGDELIIRGVAFSDGKELKQFLKREQESKKRDHRRVGVDAHLLARLEGDWAFLPKGALIYDRLQNWLTDITQFDRVISARGKGIVEGHCELFKARWHTYKELPIRWIEAALLPVERDGEQRGICKLPVQTEVVASLFVDSNQVVQELISSLQFLLRVIKLLELEHRVSLGTKGENSLLTRAQWEGAERQLVKAASSCGLGEKLERDSDTVLFPTVQLTLVDCIGREWSGMSLQVRPEVPALRYQGKGGEMNAPQLISLSLGSVEKLMALLIEQQMGSFPLWLAPEQVRVIPVAEQHQPFCKELAARLREEGFRVGVDLKNDKLGGRIRLAQIEAVPYTVVLGDREQEERVVTIRPWNDGELRTLGIDEWIAELKIESRMKQEVGIED